jgi:hypothetical protein
VEAYTKALDLDPEWAACHLRLASAYDGSGLPDAEKLTFQHTKLALSFDPSLKPQAHDQIDSGESAENVRSMVNEIIQKSESETLTDEQTQKNADQLQQKLGESPAPQPGND